MPSFGDGSVIGWRCLVTIAYCHHWCSIDRVIRSFKHKGLRRLFEKGTAKGIRADHTTKIENILAVLNRARRPTDMDFPGFGLHPLKGQSRGFLERNSESQLADHFSF
jgi:RelE-like toxin of type II toxin-antitoxin system HigB